MKAWVGAMLLPLIWSVVAAAQPELSPSDLRRENDRLRQRVQELESALGQAQQRISSLEQSVDQLQAELDATLAELNAARRAAPIVDSPGLNSAPTDAEESAPTERSAEFDPAQHPFAAPDALYEALKREYAAALDGLPFETDEQKARYLREVRRWARQIEFNRRSAIEWRVELLGVTENADRTITCEFLVLHPDSGDPIGRSFHLTLSGREAVRVRDLPNQRWWILDGSLIAAPVINEQRASMGVFNAPLFVGPFVEFDYSLTVRSIRLAPE